MSLRSTNEAATSSVASPFHQDNGSSYLPIQNRVLSDRAKCRRPLYGFLSAPNSPRRQTIFLMLARASLNNDIPPYIAPSRLGAFTSGADIGQVFRALWITRQALGAHFQIRPQLIVNAALVIARRDGVILTVLDDQLSDSVVPHNYAGLPEHIAEVGQLADRLLERAIEEIGNPLVPSPVSQFPGFENNRSGVDTIPRAQAQFVSLLKRWHHQPYEFLLVLGLDAHFLRVRPEVLRTAACASAVPVSIHHLKTA
jgi:hypothetical protein